MLVMYADPYARMLELVDNREQQLYKIKGDAGYQAVSWIDSCIAYWF